MQLLIYRLNRPFIDLTASCFVAMAAWVYEFTIVSVYGSEVIDMCPRGELLFLIPIILVPIEFLFILRFIDYARHQQVKRAIISAVFLCMLVFLLPSALILTIRSCELDSVEISRQGLSNSGIEKLEDLETARDVFPFKVRFAWSEEKIQIVFKGAKGRSEIVRKKLAVALRSESKKQQGNQ